MSNPIKKTLLGEKPEQGHSILRIELRPNYCGARESIMKRILFRIKKNI